MNTRALLLAASILLARRAEAEPDRTPTLLRASVTADELHERRTAELRARVERALEQLPEVETAHAELTLPKPHATPLDRPLPKPRALVVLQARTPVAERDVASSLRSLLGHDAELTLLQRKPPATLRAPLVWVGPFEVSAASAPLLRATLVGLLTTTALLASLLLWRARAVFSTPRTRVNHRPREPKVDPRGRSSRPP